MDRTRVKERIVKLLRMWADQPDEPQGINALLHAKQLMAKYRMEVELVDVEEAPQPAQVVVVYDGPPGQFAVPSLYNLVGRIFGFDSTIQGNTLSTWVIWANGRSSELDDAKAAAAELYKTFERRCTLFLDDDDPPELVNELRMAAAGALEVWATRRFGLPMPPGQQQEEVPVEVDITVSRDSTALVLYREKVQAPRHEEHEKKTQQIGVDMKNVRVLRVVDYFIRQQGGVTWLPDLAFRRALAHAVRQREAGNPWW